MDYERRMGEDKALVEDYLVCCFMGREPRADLYDAMRYSLLAGGKRIRPILTLEVCRACGGEPEKALPLACAVEMVHTYSLIHDDLPCMDDDDLRRGKATNHKVFGEATAMLAGDALLTAAFETIVRPASLPAQRLLDACACLAEAAGARGMVGGQALDMAGEGRGLSSSEIEQLEKLKTGALISAAAEMGCIAAGGSELERRAVVKFARNIGLAFQIRDDMLDVRGDQALLGKTVGSDAEKEKATFVSLLGMEACERMVEEKTQAAKAAVRGAFSDSGFLEYLADKLARREN